MKIYKKIFLNKKIYFQKRCFYLCVNKKNIMKLLFITPERIKSLHSSNGFLDKYLPPAEREQYHIGYSINDVNIEKTELLKELGEINARRQQIITELTK